MAQATENILRRPHVLLVEGDEVTAFAVRTLLQQCGYTVTMAKTGQEALAVFRSAQGQRIDLMLTDHLMPKMNSLEVAAEVTSSKGGPNVPVIVMSAQATQDLISKAFQSGAVDFLQKPIRHNEVVTMWQHLWKSAQMPHGGPSVKEDLSPKNCLNTYTKRLAGTSIWGGSSQEEGSGCDMQSSCTATAPAAKRIKAQSPDMFPLTSLGSCASSTLSFARAQLDVVGDSERQPPASITADRMTAEHTAGWSQVLAGCPHEAPVFSGTELGSRTIFTRVLSCPSMLAAQAGHHTGAETGSGRKRPYEYDSSSEDAAPEAPAATNDDSGNSAATAEDAVCTTIDTSPFAAFYKLSGCEGPAETSPVQLEIAPLDLTPWPSTTSSVGSMGRQGSLAPPFSAIRDHTHKQAQAAAASLCDLAKAFAAAMPWPGPSTAPPLLQPLKVSASLELSSGMSRILNDKPAAGGSSSPTGPKQAGPFGKPPKDAADPHSVVMQGSPAVWAANRRAALERLREKKKLRSFRKKVRYESRRLLAESRPRIRGQFVKAGVEVA